jgi:tRNA(Ile)-lysidine synthase
MASSRKSKRSKSLTPTLPARVRARLAPLVRCGERLVLGLSGGIDSIVLLDVLARLAKPLRFELLALHVNHGLSPNAGAWASFCEETCAARGIQCRVVKVDIPRGNSTERTARERRYAALNSVDAHYIVLAHNADDQAETVLLQLFRGTGVRGLAAMPFVRQAERVRAAAETAPAPAIVRPLLAIERRDIERYAKRRRLAWIEDESNADTSYQRNWLRHEILPLVRARVPAYRAALARTAAHMSEASMLLDDLAALDAAEAITTGTIAIERLSTLSETRAKNVLRAMMAARGYVMPSADRLREALQQALKARVDSKVRVVLGKCELRRHGASLHLVPLAADLPPRRIAVPWSGERELVLPDFGGVLSMLPRRGNGISSARLRDASVTIRPRAGGERLRFEKSGPARTVKNLLYEAGWPPWQREKVPFIYCDDALICVPGIGIDHRYRARPREASVLPLWHAYP